MDYTTVKNFIFKEHLEPFEFYFLDITEEFTKRYGYLFAPIEKVSVFLGDENDVFLARKSYEAIFAEDANVIYECHDSGWYFGDLCICGIVITFKNGEKVCLKRFSSYACVKREFSIC